MPGADTALRRAELSWRDQVSSSHEGALLAPESDLPVGMITIVLYGGCLAALLAHQARRD
ncbi:hypothetical protein LTH96_00645 [Nesterenkonia sp. LB17]|uniref:hypothetical protein n=1 Tax=Nesterenkonia sp. LB17 TaxID=2901230 RepID=UPI001F4CFE03|nr:hypothetical protein [Nesterenkonia sp. LB17]MCH8564247.1 hypothetical protein [Nesterenkonia sp. LB17]